VNNRANLVRAAGLFLWPVGLLLDSSYLGEFRPYLFLLVPVSWFLATTFVYVWLAQEKEPQWRVIIVGFAVIMLLGMGICYMGTFMSGPFITPLF
jgi:hypothetical protein